MPVACKLFILTFSTPFVGLGVIVNIVLVGQFIIKSSIKVDSERIIAYSKLIKGKTEIFKNEDIINIRNKQSYIYNKYPKVIIVTKDKEYSIGGLTGFILSNEEATWIASKISQYLKKDVVD